MLKKETVRDPFIPQALPLSMLSPRTPSGTMQTHDVIITRESTENPLPDHNGVNMIGGNMGRKIKEDIAEVKIRLRWVWKKMIERGLFVLDSERNFERVENYCEFHHKEDMRFKNVQNSEPWFKA
ncbi:hypothetical protein Goshw_011191 [Gossypium schwendimanii]|uniref:Uncharacterized protein n=1 Tax=Gossypium schwendimanii TaxID=34291 RepID=A0A7J9NAJ4_GOSSC|nr:hypothetical protein [Gossypium schwendimanii]